jgi:hypothetical protein
MLECFAIANRQLLLPGHPSHQDWSIFMPVLYAAIKVKLEMSTVALVDTK